MLEDYATFKATLQHQLQNDQASKEVNRHFWRPLKKSGKIFDKNASSHYWVPDESNSVRSSRMAFRRSWR